MLLSADTAGSLLEELEDPLTHEDILPRVAREMAEQVATRRWSLEYEPHGYQFERK